MNAEEKAPKASWAKGADSIVNDFKLQDGLVEVKAAGHAVTQGSRRKPRAVRPARWFDIHFPSLQAEFGPAVLEEVKSGGEVYVTQVNEDFLAATLGERGNPKSPTFFVPAEARFYTYEEEKGIFVQQDPASLTIRLSDQLLRCARESKAVCNTKALEFGLRAASKLAGVLKKARGLLQVPHDFFAAELTQFIPCANGMLRLRDRALLPFDPKHRRRNKLGVAFDAGAKCPLFLDTLMHPALDPDDLDLLQRWCGLPLIGENLAQRILILTGTAGGGKGTFVRVLAGIIGEANLASLRTHLLNERFEIGRFLGKTLLYGADVPQNFLNQKGASVLKQLTGYDHIALEFKNSNETPIIKCKFPIVVTCNCRLVVHLEDDSEAWRRRLAIVEYRKPKPGKVIPELDKQILAREGSGVLNFMLDGLDKLRADGWQLKLNERQQRIVDNLLLESASHAVFANERMMQQADAKLSVADCYAKYSEFCHGRGWAPQPRHKFGPLIEEFAAREFGVPKRNDIQDASGAAQCGWKGISLRVVI